MVTLYKRNGAGRPIVWQIEQEDNKLIIKHGVVNSNLHTEVCEITAKTVNELESRVTEKRKEGYKELSEIYDNAPVLIQDNKRLYNYLNTYLPKFNVSSTGAILPMLCKTLEDNKPFTKNEYWGQYKINGLRCLIGAKKTNDMFNPIKLTFQSREGTWWDLPYLEEEILPNLSGELIEMMVEEDAKLDGEIYLPGYKVNDINSFVKNPTLEQHKNLQYWNYDLAIDNTTYVARRRILLEFINNIKVKAINSKEEHLNNIDKFVTIVDTPISDYCEASVIRNKFVSLGFEGLVMRNINAEYGFNKRNINMMKFKPILDGEFKIKNIIPEGKRVDLPKFILENDTNGELFECTIKGTFDKQREYLYNKDKYIGKYMLVEYRERSGVNDVPFHAKGVRISN